MTEAELRRSKISEMKALSGIELSEEERWYIDSLSGWQHNGLSAWQNDAERLISIIYNRRYQREVPPEWVPQKGELVIPLEENHTIDQQLEDLSKTLKGFTEEIYTELQEIITKLNDVWREYGKL